MKTIEEAAKEIFTKPDDNQILAFELGVEFAQRWIPVEEELPEEKEWIIVELKNVVSKNKYVTMYPKNQLEFDFIKSNVIKWRPIELK